MTRFLSGNELSREIAKVLAGNDICCAVAFWGAGATDHLFPRKKDIKTARIICDTSMGGSNPAELRRLKALTNDNLKHADRLHAKVYVSNSGAIVCSANASANGLGFMGDALFLEAGVFLETSSAAYRNAKAWFEKTWAASKAVDEPAIKAAEHLWVRRARANLAITDVRMPADRPSLFATVAANPEHFRHVGFIVTVDRADEKQAAEARDALLKGSFSKSTAPLTPAETAQLKDWNGASTFTDWSEEDLDKWPRKFVGIHRPNSRTSYAFYRKFRDILLRQDEGVVFAEQPRGLRRELGFESGKNAMLENDRELLDALFEYCEDNDKWLFEDGFALLSAIS